MTPKIIELKQAPVVLVEKPDEDDNDIVIVSGKEIFYNGDYFELPKADFRNPWRVLGILSDLTEEQFAECVDKYPGNAIPARYVNYTYKKPNGGMQVSRVTFSWCNKSSDSFYSLLQSENVYTENPFGEKPVNKDFYWGFLDDLNKWQEAQSRTIDPSRTVVLIRKEK